MGATSCSAIEYSKENCKELNMAILKLLFINYWKLTVFKETPDNTPYSPFLLCLSSILFILIMMMQWMWVEEDFASDLLKSGVIAFSLVLSFILYSYVILFFRGLSSRLVQTTTCLFFSQIIIHGLASPLFLLDPYLAQANLRNPFLLLIGVFYLFITLGLSVWQFVITAHIYRYALDTSALQSVMASFGLIAVNILTISFWR